MNIGFDGKRAANNTTGLGNYSRSLIEQLAHFFPQNRYLLYTPKVKKTRQVDAFFKLPQVLLQLPKTGAGVLGKLLWRSIGIKRQLMADKVDLYHGLSNEIPLRLKNELKTVVTIHDLIYLRFPKNYRYIDLKIYDFKSRYACANADRIVAISEQTKNDIIEFYGTEPSKIDVIYQSCDDSFKLLLSAEEKELIRKKYNLPEKFLLNVGTIETRKNLLLVVNALKNIPASYKLVVVGKEKDYATQVKKQIALQKLQDRVIFLKDIPFTDLPAIYQLSSIFVYPSFYEGFGIPIIEALFSNVPVIAATGSCLEEAGGPGSLYVNPSDANELTAAINRIIDDKSLQDEMKSAGLQFVQKFNNDPLARQMMDCYLKTIHPI
ncbi:glycosyltransferase family 4 protein [Pedobacter sp. MC2016-14]|uniref:glycosyltransferase family 4 protein n=1 Tax=Pedobacter sp. MC2016-14 TaxID=2897327 RepID=UPI001E2EF5EA|nr:glycosyltransferase family 1 protein [Pedobacter sp. MC2016-14]MCD0490297.1 glycosyltransferase family 4 protein [Pedobacter sp. MC2016-14]